MSEHLIELQGISKVFQTDDVETHALTDINFTIDTGEYVSIAGPSGCGIRTRAPKSSSRAQRRAASTRFLLSPSLRMEPSPTAPTRARSASLVAPATRRPRAHGRPSVSPRHPSTLWVCPGTA